MFVGPQAIKRSGSLKNSIFNKSHSYDKTPALWRDDARFDAGTPCPCRAETSPKKYDRKRRFNDQKCRRPGTIVAFRNRFAQKILQAI
jgi:hypothetical protein